MPSLGSALCAEIPLYQGFSHFLTTEHLNGLPDQQLSSFSFRFVSVLLPKSADAVSMLEMLSDLNYLLYKVHVAH